MRLVEQNDFILFFCSLGSLHRLHNAILILIIPALSAIQRYLEKASTHCIIRSLPYSHDTTTHSPSYSFPPRQLLSSFSHIHPLSLCSSRYLSLPLYTRSIRKRRKANKRIFLLARVIYRFRIHSARPLARSMITRNCPGWSATMCACVGWGVYRRRALGKLAK